MKKVILFLIFIQFFSIQTFAADVITDEFVERTLKKYAAPVIKKPVPVVQDEFVERTLKNLKNETPQRPAVFIDDEFVQNSLKDVKATELKKAVIIKDEFAEQTLKSVKLVNDRKKADYTLTDDSNIPVLLRTKELLSTKGGIYEGQNVEFTVVGDVVAGNVTVIEDRGTVQGRIETITLNTMFGSPADIKIAHFVANPQSKKPVQLGGEISVVGANRSIWVYPVFYLFTIPTFGMALPIMFIRGGHAKIEPSKTYKLELRTCIQ